MRSRGPVLPVCLAILCAGIPAIAEDSGGAEAEVAPRERMVREAEALLADDLFEDALVMGGAAVEQWPDHAPAHVVKAGALYRRGDFEEAETHYRKAVALDPNNASAHFGVGRIERTLGRYDKAAEAFSTAASLSPDTPRYLRVLANHLARRQDTLEMLRRYVELVEADPQAEERSTIGNVEAWMALLERAGEDPISDPVRMEPTEVPLHVTRGQGYFRMTVAGQKKQRFVFDTGATGVTVSPRLVRKAGLEPIRGYTIAGTGAGRTETGDLVLLDSIEIGDGILIRNVPATVREPSGPEVGLIGPSLFSKLDITIDLKGGRLLLEKPGTERAGTIQPFRNVGGEIVVRTAVNGVDFNAMVDTGSASTIIGRTTVGRLPDLQALPGQWFAGTTVGVGGPLGERKVILKGTLTVAGREFPADGLLSGDLDGFSRAVESEIYVILGVPHLDDFILTIDYRDMTVTFAEHSSRKSSAGKSSAGGS